MRWLGVCLVLCMFVFDYLRCCLKVCWFGVFVCVCVLVVCFVAYWIFVLRFTLRLFKGLMFVDLFYVV